MNNDLINARKQILDSFLNNLHGISDKKYQERIWIKRKGPECDDFVETVCDFFDLGDYIFESPQSYSLTDKQYNMLVEFRDKFKIFADENNYPEEFIDTEEWAKIMEMAKEVLKAFHYQKKI